MHTWSLETGLHQAHLQVQYQSEVTNWPPGDWGRDPERWQEESSIDEMTPQHGRRYEASIPRKSRLSHLKRTQEADNWANMGAQGQRKIVLDRRDNAETWMAASLTMTDVDVVW